MSETEPDQPVFKAEEETPVGTWLRIHCLSFVNQLSARRNNFLHPEGDITSSAISVIPVRIFLQCYCPSDNMAGRGKVQCR